MNRAIAICLAGAAALAGGCAFPGLPPALSVARFVRIPSGGAVVGAESALGRGMVNASAGLAFTAGEDGSSAFYSFVPEAALSLWFHERYDFTVAVDSYRASLEGNLVLLESPVRLGILHGLGGGIVTALSDPGGTGIDPTFLATLSVGVFAQFPSGPHDAAFTAARYAYSTSDDTALLPTHYVTVNAGWVHEMGAFRLAPEIALGHGWSLDDDPSTPPFGFWIIVPGVTASAAF
jgi:hypothetical protein